MNARFLAVGLLALALPATAQIDLSAWNLRSVRVNNWGAVALPEFDSVGLVVRVRDGVARTRATLVWTAGGMRTPSYRFRCHAPEPETTFVSGQSWMDFWNSSLYHDTTYRYLPYAGVDSLSYTYRTTTCAVDSILYAVAPMDSLELSTSFQLPTDAVVSNLSLWVGDAKQSAWIMDRSQATAQYNQIVGVRRDPALLETWGGGSHTLRVFPQATGQTRRLEIEITQAWREGMELPLKFVRPPTQYTWFYNGTGYVTDSVASGYPRKLTLRLESQDAAPVSLDLGALGTVTASSGSALRDWSEPGAFGAKAKAGTREVWAATRDGLGAFGARTVFRGSDFQVEPEPRDRLIVLDAIHVVERARRLALLALVQYGTRGNRVDLAWRDREGILRRLWTTPREFTTERALEAVEALKAWTPSDSLDPVALLDGLRATDSGKVVVLLSDLSAPSFEEPYPSYPYSGDSVLQANWTEWYRRSNAFWQARSDAWTNLGKAFHARHMKFFGWWRDYNAYNAAAATGGYGFGDLEWGTWRWWRTGDSLVVPELFGATRQGWDEGFQGADLHWSGLAVDSMVHDLPGTGYRNWGFWIDGPVLARPTTLFLAARTASPSVAARAASVALPDSLAVTLAGRNHGAGSLAITAEGFWGGLDVKATRTLIVPAAASTEGAAIWAGQYVRKIQPWIWTTDSLHALARSLGRTYRIATPATSFLALEPGVAPYDSLGGQDPNSSADGAKTGATASMNYVLADGTAQPADGVLLDTLSLEALLAGRVLSTSPKVRIPTSGLKLVASRGLAIHAGASAEAPRVRILDLSGRELASPVVSADGEGWSATWRPTRAAIVVVQMVQDGRSYAEKAAVRP